MKNYLMVAGLALAMIGCAHNRGGVGEDSERQTGYDNNYKMPKTEKSSSSSVTNEINSTSERSTVPSSEDNQSPTTPQN